MTDVLTPAQRRLVMSRIKGRDTKPEIVLRKLLHADGFRYRLHAKGLPGRPDLVFHRYKAVIFVHGCFWHGHDCPLFRLPSTRREFWETKIQENRKRDQRQIIQLTSSGWRCLVVWECSMRGKARHPVEILLRSCSNFLNSDASLEEISGAWISRENQKDIPNDNK
ncbi:very short patch repair endonuclease [Methylorubrum salsuginis]|uniref:very short patch repair endonuclease n=1 Tax=Methylorubrum salsuginis TaxID=414703 RepID=UPI000B89230D|nr:very short patch repair endonuclease [Methylorubrum salsuginis]